MAPSSLPLILCALASVPFSNAKMDPGSYAPKTNQACLDTLLRQPPASNQTLHPNESQYLADRRKLFPDAWRAWVGDGSHLGYDLNKLGITANNGSGLPEIAIATSGGGYRAAQGGAGIISGLDARNATAKAKGTGGLVQVSSYLSGLSGGSWLISSMVFHDFPDMYDLVLGNTHKGGDLNGWLLEKDLALPNGLTPFDNNNENYFGSILWSVDDKGRTGLDTSLTDIWSCALAYHFLTGLGDRTKADTITSQGNFFTNDTSHGAGVLWSHMVNIPTFQKRFSKLSPTPDIPLNSTQYEFTPWELGSYDPNLSAFVDIRFMGTHLVNGKPANSSACVTEFDQASFIFGTSSSLFNVLLSETKDQIKKFESYASNAILGLLRRMLAAVSTRADDVGNYPNPFQGINPTVYHDSNSTWIELVDGGLNKENVPLGPLLVKARHLDVIVAIDASADDSDNWPQGISLYATRDRTQQVTTSIAQRFPPIPDNQADINRLGLNRRPTFFGCDPKENPAEFPLLIYIPNAPPVDGSDPVTNPGSFKLQYQPWHTSQFLDQAQTTAFSGFLEGQLGADPTYGSCLQCAAIDRARLKTNPITPRSDICSKCFKKYCFDPENPPPEGQIVGRRLQFKDPDPFGVKSFFEKNKIPFIVGGVIAGLALIVSIACCINYCRKRSQGRKERSAQYQRLATDGSEWSAHAGQSSYELK